jgi:hypothetical protein|tara:strand:- start:1470 stop:2396 length:927 start_codon:yes stop_codon:yes gene_type:complete
MVINNGVKLNKIHIITIKDRVDIFEKSKVWWESFGWEVIPVYNDGNGIGVGRNKVLRKFYDSNDDWVCIADDDAILLTEDIFKSRYVNSGLKSHLNLSEDLTFPKLDYKHFLTNNEKLFKNKYLPTTFTAIRQIGLQGRFEIIDLLKNINNDVYKNNWIFHRAPKVFGTLCFHQNTKKKYNKEFYQKNRKELPSLQDWEWSIQQINAGLTTAVLTNIIINDITGPTGTRGKSSLFKTLDERKKKMKISKKRIAEEYKMRILDNGALFLKDWLKKKWKPPVKYSEFCSALIKEHIWTTDSKPKLFIEEI